MLIKFDNSMRNAITRSINSLIESVSQAPKRYERDLKRLLNEVKSKKPSSQLYKKIKAIIVKIISSIVPFVQNTHFIDTNTLSQTTYYKTLTSRP